MPEFKNYSFKNVDAIFGIEEVKGWGDGDDVLTIDPETEQFQDAAGAKGDVVRTQTNDNRCTITIKLLQSSTFNKKLMAIHTADRDTHLGVYPMFVQDKETGEKYVINNSWIVRYPTIIRGQGKNLMEWIFRGDFLTGVIT